MGILALIGGGYMLWLSHMQNVIMVMQEDIKKIYLMLPPRSSNCRE